MEKILVGWVNDRYSHVVLEVTVLICSVSSPCFANKSPCEQVPTQRTLEPHCIPFQANQVFHVFNSLVIAMYLLAAVHVLNTLTPGLVSTSLWLVGYISSSHIGCIPLCIHREFCVHCVEFLLGSPVPFTGHWTIIITN